MWPRAAHMGLVLVMLTASVGCKYSPGYPRRLDTSQVMREVSERPLRSYGGDRSVRIFTSVENRGVVVRIVDAGGVAQGIVKTRNGLLTHAEFALAAEEFSRIWAMVEEAEMWTQPQFGEHIRLHAPRCGVEVSTPGRYSLVERYWQDSVSVRSLCVAILDAAGVAHGDAY